MTDLVETPPNVELRRQPLELFAAAVALVLPLAYSPTMKSGFWSPKYAILLLVTAAGLPLLACGISKSDRSSQAAAGFLLVAATSTLLSKQPSLALLGLYGWGTGLLFWAAAVAAWAIGRALPSADAGQLVRRSILMGATLNAAIGILQIILDLSAIGLEPYAGRGYGLLGNPIHLGALTAGSCALVVATWTDRKEVVSCGLLLIGAAGLQASGTRIALAAAIGAIALGLRRVSTWRRRALVVVVFVSGLGFTTLLPPLADTSTLSSRLTGGDAIGGSTARLETWSSARHAIAQRPMFGWGPGRFREATAPLRTLEMARAEGNERIFVDAHNVFVELAVVTGVVGLLSFVAWMAFASRGARAPELLFAGTLGVVALVQPLTVGVTPLAFLMLGVAGRTGWSLPRPVVLSQVGLAVTAGIAATGLLLGDFSARQAELDFELNDAEFAEQLLRPWPQLAALLAKVTLYESILAAPDDPELLQQSIRWREEAVSRDPSDPASWNQLGELRLVVPDLRGASAAFRGALLADPQSFRARLGLAQAALVAGDFAEASRWLDEARLRATSPAEHKALDRMQRRAAV